jgi:hypothetical protein
MRRPAARIGAGVSQPRRDDPALIIPGPRKVRMPPMVAGSTVVQECTWNCLTMQSWSQRVTTVSKSPQVAERVSRQVPLPAVALGCVPSAP